MSDSTVPIEAELTLVRPRYNKARRRTAHRYRCALASSGKVFFPVTAETLRAWFNNLSTTGVGLNLPRALDAGTVLVIQVRVEGSEQALRIGARVIHSSLEVDGTWRVGCNFDEPLTNEMLESLL